MRLAVVGVHGSGKSTLFRAFTGVAGAPPAGGGPGAAPLAAVKVRDPRLEKLRDMFQPKKYTPAGVEVIDLPGLPGPGEPSSARKPDLLAAARESDGLLLVVRAFEEPSYPYADAAPDPAKEAAHLAGELTFADLDVATKRLEKLRASGRKSGVKEQEKKECEALERIVKVLEEGGHAKDAVLSHEEEKILRGFRFLTWKPWVLAVSIPEGGPQGLADGLPGKYESRATLCGKAEAEIAELEEADRASFLTGLGIARPAAEVLLEAAFRGLGLLAFFTVGEDEVRAWTLRGGSTAVEAAGCIHSDLARGFIRAEVVSSADLLSLGDMQAVKKAGKHRLEGKEYVVQDGDVINIRFSV
jgi:GTP-binding protein YchF